MEIPKFEVLARGLNKINFQKWNIWRFSKSCSLIFSTPVTLKKSPFCSQNFNQDEVAGFVRYTNNMYMKNILRTILDPNILILLPSESSTPKGTSLQFSNITFYLEVVWYFRTFYLAVVRKIWQYGKIRIGELSIFSSDTFFVGYTQRHKNAKKTRILGQIWPILTHYHSEMYFLVKILKNATCRRIRRIFPHILACSDLHPYGTYFKYMCHMGANLNMPKCAEKYGGAFYKKRFSIFWRESTFRSDNESKLA